LDTIYAVMSREHPDAPPVRPQEPLRGVSLPSPPAAPARSLRVLVGEDNEFNAQLLKQLLLRKGYSVTVAKDGRAVLRQLDEQCFDLLLLDLHMPEADGFQVIAAIRAREEGGPARLPVIALTARSRREDRQRCLAAGMDDFLVKPILAAALWSAIESVLPAPFDAAASEGGLLDPTVLLATCGGDALALERICGALQSGLPNDLAELAAALDGGDSSGAQRVAHRLVGVMSAFSTVAAALASELEDNAARGDVVAAQAAFARLKPLAEELMRLVARLSLNALLPGS